MSDDAEALRELGQRIRALRRGRGMTQDRLGDLSGISGVLVGYLERGVKVPVMPTLIRLAQALETTVPVMMADLPAATSARGALQLRLLAAAAQASDDELRRLVATVEALVALEAETADQD